VVARGASILLAVLGLASVTPAAFANSGDVAATGAYIRAGYTTLRIATADLATTRTALVGLTRQITGQCPRAAAGSPQNHDSEQLSNEVVGALTVTAYRTDAGAIATFARAVRGLRWSNRTLTRAVATSATRLRGNSTLAAPDVCGDVEAWVASGFQTLPASAVQFNRRYSAVDIEAEEVPLRLFAPYERGDDASLLRHIERFEASIAEFEASAVKYYAQIMNTLELQP
jgi:hypothetical protein